MNWRERIVESSKAQDKNFFNRPFFCESAFLHERIPIISRHTMRAAERAWCVPVPRAIGMQHCTGEKGQQWLFGSGKYLSSKHNWKVYFSPESAFLKTMRDEGDGLLRELDLGIAKPSGREPHRAEGLLNWKLEWSSRAQTLAHGGSLNISKLKFKENFSNWGVFGSDNRDPFDLHWLSRWTSQWYRPSDTLLSSTALATREIFLPFESPFRLNQLFLGFQQ